MDETDVPYPALDRYTIATSTCHAQPSIYLFPWAVWATRTHRFGRQSLHFLPRIQMDILNKKGAARLASHDLSQDPSREFIQEAGHGEARRRSSRCSSVIDTGAAPRRLLRVRAGRRRGDHARPDLDG